MWVKCSNISVGLVRKVFEEKFGGNGFKVIANFKLAISQADMHLPSNLLADHYVLNEINIECLEKEIKNFKIDSNAFSSSRNFLKVFKVSLCDISGLNLFFFQGFEKLSTISFDSIANANLVNWTTLPPLPKLATLDIINSKGLDKWAQFPFPINMKLKYLNLFGNKMDDLAMDQFLQWIDGSPSSDFLDFLDLGENALTQIPRQLSSFKKLSVINLDRNRLIKIIPSGSFNFSHLVKKLLKVV